MSLGPFTRVCIISFAMFAVSVAPVDASAEAAETRLLRSPSIGDESIVFVYANDVWRVDRAGGDARRLTVFVGAETSPHLSPDGSLVAFSGEYGGNTDVYVVPIAGGAPRRLTWHPGLDDVRGFTPDGERVIFASGRSSPPAGAPKFWAVSIEGGLPEPMPLPRVWQGDISSDGHRIAYQMVRPWESEFRNYRGGQNNPIRVADLETLEVTKLPWDGANDHQPVYLGEEIYFLSDRDHATNVWSWRETTGELRQRTFFVDYDCKSLEAGGGAVVFENGGSIYTLDPSEDEPRRVPIEVRGDFPWARPRWEPVHDMIRTASLSPTGKRAAFEARGEIFTVPEKHGDVRNLTESSGSAERSPAWSPDGSRIAWFSDEGGEYALAIADQRGDDVRRIQLVAPTFFYTPVWSPDGSRIAYTDADRNLWVLDVQSGRARAIDDEGYATPARVIEPRWAPGSRYLAYSKRLANEHNAIFVHDLEAGESRQITDGLADARYPAWDRSGKYLYFLASTDYGLNVSWLDMSSMERPLNHSIYVAVLDADAPSPLAPRSDDEPTPDDDPPKDEAQSEGADGDEAEGGDDAVVIDFDGLDQRILALDVPARPYDMLRAGPEGLIFYTERVPNEPGLTLHRYSTTARKADVVMKGITSFIVSHDGKKLLYAAPNDTYGIVGAQEQAKVGDGRLDLGGMRAFVDPQAEWQQIFDEALRFQRDYFYVENVHGLDLEWARRSYEPWLEHVRHRADLTYLLDILGGETAVGHSFTGGGDEPEVDSVPVGLLGADLEIDDGRYRIAKIYRGENWNPELRAPLSGPGLDVREGEYLLAIEGVELTDQINPYSLLEYAVDREVRLTVSPTSSLDESRVVSVRPIEDEGPLRTRAWIESNRRRVDELSDGRLAYVWLPDTWQGGYTAFNRSFFSQKDKAGIVVDERFNRGGLIADYVVDLLSREIVGFFNNPVGDRRPWTAPNAGIWGPKVMIINESAGSGGDMLPYMFRAKNLGVLVGTRTWGGLVGIWDVPAFIDGGFMTAPRGGFYDLEGEWAVENVGVAPDVVVEQDPAAVAAGGDPQLEAAVEIALRMLETEAVEILPQPPDPVRVKRP